MFHSVLIVTGDLVGYTYYYPDERTCINQPDWCVEMHVRGGVHVVFSRFQEGQFEKAQKAQKWLSSSQSSITAVIE